MVLVPMATDPGPVPLRIRDAATIVLWRPAPSGPQVLMGKRGAGAAFMPTKFVFPGGAVDAADADVALAAPLPDTCAGRLRQEAHDTRPEALAAAAIRELHEETGLAMARPLPSAAPAGEGPDWLAMASRGLVPEASALRFVFRAITPPGRPRRFDARFFLAPATAIAGDPDDFATASGELSDLTWTPLDRAMSLDLPFITEVVLAEIAALLRGEAGMGDGVPFFDNRTDRPTFRRLL